MYYKVHFCKIIFAKAKKLKRLLLLCKFRNAKPHLSFFSILNAVALTGGSKLYEYEHKNTFLMCLGC